MTYKVGSLTSDLLGVSNGVCPLDSNAKINSTYERHNTKIISLIAIPSDTDITTGSKIKVLLPTSFSMYFTQIYCRVETAGDSTGETVVDLHLDGTSILDSPMTFYGTSLEGAATTTTNPIVTSVISPVFLEVIVDSVHNVTPPKGLYILLYFQDKTGG